MGKKFYLAGDIGGTKTLLQLATVEGVQLVRSYPSGDYPGLAEIIEIFLVEAGVSKVAAACFAVAGPVADGHAGLTNLPWQLDQALLASRFGIAQVALVNDFQAAGMGIEALGPGDLFTLQLGMPQQHGVRTVVGAGTGLGVGYLAWCGDGYAVHASEGSHADFAPVDDVQDELLEYLRSRYGHVSCERVVSGPGLAEIFRFFEESGRGLATAELAAALAETDTAAAVAEFALAQRDPLAEAALDLFVAVYGAVSGNIALTFLPRGGIYIAGGIAPKILPKLRQGGFLRAFCDKGRFAGLLETIPVHVVTNSHIGLLGAARIARSLTKC